MVSGMAGLNIARLGRHLIANRARVKRVLPAEALGRIAEAIAAAEAQHAGQIRVVVEGALDGEPLFRQQSARDRALDVFSLQRVWDTERNNGVLIYLLLADRDVEIIADRGIHRHVGADGWESICRAMEAAFARDDFEAGLTAGIAAVSQHLATHFPKDPSGGNELPDDVVVM
jgi:uncharacterized membrane protein